MVISILRVNNPPTIRIRFIKDVYAQHFLSLPKEEICFNTVKNFPNVNNAQIILPKISTYYFDINITSLVSEHDSSHNVQLLR